MTVRFRIASWGRPALLTQAMNTTTNIPYRVWLLGAFLVLLPLSCINAASMPDLLLQHAPTVVLLVLLIATGVRHPLSNLSYTMFFGFLLLHLVGARHLYSFVPYDNWTEQLCGGRLGDTFGFRRNHYDRLVHTCFGLLLFYPAHEIIVRLMKIRGAWSLVIAVWLIVVFGTMYELLEWVVAMEMSPDATERYNGQQGDMWDAHKDMALATGGAVFSALLLAFFGRSGYSTHGTGWPLTRTRCLSEYSNALSPRHLQVLRRGP